jgi:hypothetical protein
MLSLRAQEIQLTGKTYSYPITGLDRRLRRDCTQSAHEGGKAVSPMHWLLLSPRRLLLRSNPTQGCRANRRRKKAHFCCRMRRPQSLCVASMIKSMKNPNYPAGNQTCDLLACSTVPQLTAPLHM